MVINPENVYSYLRARTPEGLKSLMVAKNFKAGKYYRYNIMFADGFWFAWYEELMTEVELESYVNNNGRKG